MDHANGWYGSNMDPDRGGKSASRLDGITAGERDAKQRTMSCPCASQLVLRVLRGEHALLFSSIEGGRRGRSLTSLGKTARERLPARNSHILCLCLCVSVSLCLCVSVKKVGSR